ncbi:unnamed protein product [Danaus chrysippus]|uniref:(African queen) hypothetical protein n=1 Tax=Danaus chrysippus TaxID=151541 RepID=A0A8J2QS79_9NEOP|nr:unnamed protein product [Danaus chrysippus]
MRSLSTVVAAILFTGSVYCTLPSIVTQPEGGSFTAGIINFDQESEKCFLKTPADELVVLKPIDGSSDKYELLPEDDVIRCRVLIKQLTQNDNGIWTLHMTTKSGNEDTQSYNVTVLTLETTEPPTTTEKDQVEIENLPAQNINTTLGTSHIITIPDFSFVTSERCIIVTPSGERIGLQELKDSSVIQAITDSDAACAVKISVNNEDAIGDWLLISEGTRFSKQIERRLPFAVRVEENVDASMDEVTLAEGNDFYIRLKNSIPDSGTCRLVGPNGSRNFEIDQRYSDVCGFLVREVIPADAGTWEIQYGDKILYRARVILHVKGNSANKLDPLTWSRDNHLNTTLGPETAIYCKLESPSGRIVYDGFGRCRAVIDRVTMEHDGLWKMTVGAPGGVFTQKYEVTVKVVERSHDTPAITSVSYNKPVVIMTCKATSRVPFNSCKFRNPVGEILLASEGVGQGRYSFHGNGTSFNEGLYTHECGFQLSEPQVRELGFWRCVLETADGNHYGFLKVLPPWSMRDPEVVAGIVRTPSVTPSGDVTSLSGTSVRFHCSSPAALRYCYFRARNGTVYNVDQKANTPYSIASSNYEGNGFPSGECGIRFESLVVNDSGPWSCHVGIEEDGSLIELRSSFNVAIHEPMVVNQWMEKDRLMLTAQVHGSQQLEYCRFVRIDGLGFTSVSLPRYTDTSDLSVGRCGLIISGASIMERHPWTVVARVEGGDELVGTSTPTLDIPRPIRRRSLNFPLLIIMSIGIILIILGAIVGPKRNREWAAQRTSAFRNSLRNSFRKKPLQADSNVNTACAA